MKHITYFKFYIFIALLFISLATLAQNDFITTWRTTTANESITIPTTYGGYSYTVNWGDGSTDNVVYMGDASHSYVTPGDYQVSISGAFPRIYFANASGNNKLKIIE